jgi:hypothetical protein
MLPWKQHINLINLILNILIKLLNLLKSKSESNMNQPQKLNKILPEIVKMIMKEKILKMLRTIKNHLLNSILKNNMNYN